MFSSVLFFLAEYSAEKRGDQKCAVQLGLCHLHRALGYKTRIGGERFTRACSDSIRDNGFKLIKGRFRLDTGKKFFTVRVVRYRNGFPVEAVDAPSPEMFKAVLHRALSNLV